ncbi:MAG TPA: pyridoxamine 5'-phosphate oxidase [Pirellulaceae bacterium]|nr:pyridoxamine 5'-phosphate oxidase [Pirellulaceae bacterium]
MTTRDLAELRQEYADQEWDVEIADASPFKQFDTWFQQAQQAELLEPNAMVLATVSSENRPTQRTVLLKYFDNQGFVFFTNYNSRKSKQISDNPRVSLLFLWLPLHRQVEISGAVQRVSMLESVQYFARRPRDSQLGAWVSEQSAVVSSRSLLMAKFEEIRRKFAEGEVPLPSFWGGYRVVPDRFEFWQGRASRLHDRIEYVPMPNNEWQRHRLSP